MFDPDVADLDEADRIIEDYLQAGEPGWTCAEWDTYAQALGEAGEDRDERADEWADEHTA